MRFYLLPVILLFFGCEQVKVQDALRETRSNKYLQVVDAGRFRINIRFMPRTLQLLAQSKIDTSRFVNDNLLDSLEKAQGLGKGMVFVVRISPLDGLNKPGFENDLIYGNQNGFDTYQDALHEYAFGLKEKIWIEANGKKIPVTNYQMENSFGMTPGRAFTFLFSGISEFDGIKSGGIKLVLDDIVPGLSIRKLTWIFPVGKYDQNI